MAVTAVKKTNDSMELLRREEKGGEAGSVEKRRRKE